MKQAQLKSILVLVLAIAFFSLVVYAFERIQINYPVDEWVLSNSVPFNFTVNTTSASISYCAVYANNSGTFTMKANYTDVTNATKHIAGISINDSVGLSHGWYVVCNNGSNDFNYSTNVSFGVDGNIPSITLDSPAGGAYLTNLNNTLFQYTPTDTSNPDTCLFYTNITGTWKFNQTNSSYGSGIQISVNLSNNTNSLGYTSAAYPDGTYIWGATCNDTATNLVSSQNRTFVLDSVFPAPIRFLIPTNNLTSSNTSLYVVWNQTTETNFDKYQVLVSPYKDNMSDPTTTVEITSITTNFTTLTFGTDGVSFIQVRAFDLAGQFVNTTFTMNYTLDRIAPLITLNFPQNNSFLSDSTPDFNVTLNDTNPNSCTLLLSNTTSSDVISNGTKFPISNGTRFNLTPITMNDGVYSFNVECNDSVGVRVNASAFKLQVTIDTVSPSHPNITSIFHQTNNTNRYPTLIWNLTTELNFSKYQARAFYELNGSLAYETNITAITTFSVNMNLSANYTYNFSVIAHDLAGNTAASANTSIQTRYFIDPVCGRLFAGWNLCGAVWTTPKSLSLIANETGANQVAVFNSSHKFATCNADVSTTGQHCNNVVSITTPIFNFSVYNTSINHHVFIYVNSSTDYRNRTWVANKLSANVTITNASGTGWNILPGIVRNGNVFGHIKNQQGFVTNVSLFSLPYNNGTTRPYVNQGLFRGINNLTNLDYGRAMWIFYNGTPILDDVLENVSLANSTLNIGGW